MEVKIVGRGIEVGPQIEEYVRKKLKSVERDFHPQSRAEVILGKENFQKVGEIIIRGEGNKEIFARSKDKNLLTAIDKVIERVKRQLRKRKGTVKNKMKHYER